MRVSSHTLGIEVGWASRVAREARLCRVCHQELEFEEHFICRCPIYYEIRGRYHCLFTKSFGPLRRIMEYPDQRFLGLLLMEIHTHREMTLQEQTHPQAMAESRIISVFQPVEGSTTPTTAIQTHMPSKGFIARRASEMQSTQRPLLPGSLP